MFKIFTLTILAISFSGGFCEEFSPFLSKLSKSNDRQRRLLFYDEEGNLVKTYTNPFLRDFAENAEKIPFFGSFINPFFNFLRPSTFAGSPTTYMIPVSDEVVQQINNDPIYQNKILYLPQKDSIVETNPLCMGKRAQIPDPKLCSNFLNCWDGWAFEQECPAGLLFSNEGYCDYANKVDCNLRKLRDDPQPLCTKDFETFRNELKCSEFFVCVNRVPIRFKCPADLAFSQTLGICDYPQRTNCSISTASVAPVLPFGQFQPTDATERPSPSTPGGETAPMVPKSNTKSVMMTNSVIDSHSWTTTHVAMSRQDAIRQLQLGRIANVITA